VFVAIINHLWGHHLLPCQNNTGTKYTGCHPSVDGVWNFHKGADTVLVALYRQYWVVPTEHDTVTNSFYTGRNENIQDTW